MRCYLTIFALALSAYTGIGNATIIDFETRIDGNTVVSIDATHSRINLYDESHLNALSGADISYLSSFNESSTTLYEGSEVSYLTTFDTSRTEVLGGALSYLGIFGNSTADIRKGEISALTLSQSSSIALYGYDFSFSGSRLSGRWSDGTAFSFWLNSAETWPAIPILLDALPSNLTLHPVPLPATVWLLICGLLLLVLVNRNVLTRSVRAAWSRETTCTALVCHTIN
ncbi:MAG TPA: hypothetical protein VGN07_17820 [Steroidobacteraceae bacterium]|jgi:hypothetical protein